MDPAVAAQWLSDLWPTGVPPADYGRAAALILKLTGGAVRSVAVTATPVKRGPGRPKGSGVGKRGPGRPPKSQSPGSEEPVRERVLPVLAAYPDGLTGAQIAERLDSPAPTVYSALNALRAEDVVVREKGRFFVKPGVGGPQLTPDLGVI